MNIANLKLRKVGVFSIVLAVFGFFVVGCASTGPVETSYNASMNQTEYETDPIAIPGLSLSGGFGTSSSLEVWAKGQCRGQQCKPDRVTLYFQVPASSSMRRENRAVEFIADGERLGSARPEMKDARDTGETAEASGIVATMEMSFDDFRSLAEAEDVTGSFGTSDFSLSQGKRSPFRALVQEVMNPSKEQASGEM